MPFPPDDVEFENVTVSGELRVGDYPDGQYIRLADIAGATILFASGDADETTPGFINQDEIGAAGTRQLTLDLTTGFFADRARISMLSESFDASIPSSISLDAAQLEVTSDVAHTVTDTTDASGFVTFNHGAATTPKFVAAVVQSPSSAPAAFCTAVDNIGATTARARFLAFSGGVLGIHASASVTFRVLTLI